MKNATGTTTSTSFIQQQRHNIPTSSKPSQIGIYHKDDLQYNTIEADDDDEGGGGGDGDEGDEGDDDEGRCCDHQLVSFPSHHVPLQQQEEEEEENTQSESGCNYRVTTYRYIQQHTSSFMKSFLCGQCIAIIVTSMNTSSYLLIAKHHVHTNFFQLFFVYILLVLLNQNYAIDGDLDHTTTNHDTTKIERPQSHERLDDDNLNSTLDEDDVNDDGVVHYDSNKLHDDKTYSKVRKNSHLSTTTSKEDCIAVEESLTTTTTTTAASPTLYLYSISLFDFREHRWTDCTILQLRLPIYYYVLISLMDIVSNVLSIYSFHYTTLTSTTLLGSISIPSTMFFARLLLRKVFTPIQYIGIILCIIGGCYTIYLDSISPDDNTNTHVVAPNDSNIAIGNNNNNTSSEHLGGTNYTSSQSSQQSHQYIGDLMALTAALLYGLGDCVAEYSIKYINRKEYLYMIGMLGMIFTIVIVPIFEYGAVKDIFTNSIAVSTTSDGEIYNEGNNSINIYRVKIIILFAWFITSVTLYYMIEALFLLYYDATFLNLSMQSVNLWAYMIMYIINPDGIPSSNFFIALSFVLTGVCLYEMGSAKPHEHIDDQRTISEVNGDNMKSYKKCNCRICCRDLRCKTRSDSEVDIVRGPNEHTTVNYHSVKLVRDID